MKATEFCYWLQGFFELTSPTTLTTAQVQCINKHLDLAIAYGDKDDSPQRVKNFIGWLKTSLEWLDPAQPEQVQKVKLRLDECFAHVIDKQYGPDDHLNKIHNEHPGITMRC